MSTSAQERAIPPSWPFSPSELSNPPLPPLIPDGLFQGHRMHRIARAYTIRDGDVLRAAQSLANAGQHVKTIEAIIIKYLCSMKLLEQEYARFIRYGPRGRLVADTEKRNGRMWKRSQGGHLFRRAVQLRIFSVDIPTQRYRNGNYLDWLVKYWASMNCARDVKTFGGIWECVAGRRFPLCVKLEFLGDCYMR